MATCMAQQKLQQSCQQAQQLKKPSEKICHSFCHPRCLGGSFFDRKRQRASRTSAEATGVSPPTFRQVPIRLWLLEASPSFPNPSHSSSCSLIPPAVSHLVHQPTLYRFLAVAQCLAGSSYPAVDSLVLLLDPRPAIAAPSRRQSFNSGTHRDAHENSVTQVTAHRPHLT